MATPPRPTPPNPTPPPKAPAPPPSPPGRQPRRVYKVLANTEAEEEAFDYIADRNHPNPTGFVGAVAHMVKGALGGGILGCHVAYSKCGAYLALFLNVLFGMYLTYCLFLLVNSAQTLYKRTRISTMTYSDVGECAMACFPNPKVARFSRCFRYTIDAIISLDLFGSCACYQLIIAKTIKQLVENTERTSMEGLTPNHPSIRVYLAIMIVPIILICLIRHLKYLAPFSLAANFFVLLAICTAVYYCAIYNPKLQGLKPYNTVWQTFEYTGVIVFTMSCSGIVIPVENNMREPKKFPMALATGMSIIVSAAMTTGFFGYAAFLDKAESPITMNFPMVTFQKVLKALIAVMIYVTHALNFWPPFQLCFYYIQPCHNPEKIVMWEYIYRASFVLIISMVAITFPTIDALMGFLGAFCLSNMAFIWPISINLMVIWERPGLGKYKWRLWRAVGLIAIALFIFACGTVVNLTELIKVYK